MLSTGKQNKGVSIWTLCSFCFAESKTVAKAYFLCLQVSLLPPLRAGRRVPKRCSLRIAASYRETGQPYDITAAARQKVGEAAIHSHSSCAAILLGALWLCDVAIHRRNSIHSSIMWAHRLCASLLPPCTGTVQLCMSEDSIELQTNIIVLTTCQIWNIARGMEPLHSDVLAQELHS